MKYRFTPGFSGILAIIPIMPVQNKQKNIRIWIIGRVDVELFSQLSDSDNT